MLEKVDKIEKEALAELETVSSNEELHAWKVRYLGRSAELGEVMQGLKDLDAKQRPLVGKRVNEVKVALEEAYDERVETIRQKELSRSLKEDRLDVTLPGRAQPRGRLHPATQTLRRIYAIWADMGFQVYRSREVETDEYNFELLNMPAYHPARDMWDTFYTSREGIVLRTHTSPGQIHVMRERTPEPIRVILPGMCYRYEQITARAEIQFNQVEGLAVGKTITFADLKGTLRAFAQRMFDQDVRTRFRAQHFPFTEPSAEMDIECFLCEGVGCAVCKYTGWLEILGCGMVHPTVLRNGGYDPEEFSGFAFGMGPERIAMLRYNIGDIRMFWGNDLRFLEQF
ncbi:MAG: phenylalanine--tRNA ligase subunit alpha [Anaerolineales bacterium]|nr:phenylalanine--tRNA ligase subunit alpha [Anaerolineales bacterium]